MPLDFISYSLINGPPEWARSNFMRMVYVVATAGFLVLLKKFCSGRTNTSERPMHGKVVIITGGTTGVGARVANDLAKRGAQIVLLTHVPPSDPFLAEYIQDLRDKYDNQLIYAEQVDLSSLHSIRKFATKWIDNAPPRRLDMIVLCAATLTPPGKERVITEDGIEETWMVNYLANFHLLAILSPALRAQPFDRDVRILVATCSSYIRSPSLKEPIDESTWSPTVAYARSKLALTTFGHAYQKHLDSYKRPDGFPVTTRVVFVDPGFCRTAGMRRWLTKGTLTGLTLYVLGYFVPWMLLKSPEQGAQSFYYAAMDGDILRGGGGKLIKECREVDFARPEVKDEEVAKKLWEESDALIEKMEKAASKRRAAKRKEEELLAVKREDKDKSDDTASLRSLKKSKSRDKSSKDKKRDKDKDEDRKKDKSKSEKSKSSSSSSWSSSKRKSKKTDP
ncbi:short chain dehydrogenase/ reductase [Emericellopsis atlantica]|uniref:Short chain dehydrogenase/ reductase n=1 Tax=Emericellopsis atlantica TaxID=2614577 RepID=A0A9P8CN00_9HYPO|nr:short chain dehydrogenase/ reductase [Emericellopsis atlantica]KAG9252642.1 short chain dehydrogenase/ reductase [Emericellopsis atlantica]